MNNSTIEGMYFKYVVSLCCQRMGDAGLSADSFSLNFDMSSFFPNMLHNIENEQVGEKCGAPGAYPVVAQRGGSSSRIGHFVWTTLRSKEENLGLGHFARISPSQGGA